MKAPADLRIVLVIDVPAAEVPRLVRLANDRLLDDPPATGPTVLVRRLFAAAVEEAREEAKNPMKYRR